MVRHVEPLEPEAAQLRQHAALVGDAARQHPVERADAVGAHQQQPVAQVVNIANLSAADGQFGQRSFQNRSGHGGAEESGCWIIRRP